MQPRKKRNLRCTGSLRGLRGVEGVGGVVGSVGVGACMW